MTDALAFIGYIRDHPDQFRQLFLQHLELTGVSVAVGLAIALPLAVLASRVEALAKPMGWISGVGQTIPSLAILALVLPWLGIGFVPALVALTVRAILPIFLNAYIGIRDADAAVIDAARGMGASDAQRLFLVEIPLASPVIFAGVQTALVQSVGTATLAAFIGGGGLGDLILQGLALVDLPVLLAGAIPVALLAMAADLLMGGLRRFLVPAGLQVRSA